ncbi:MAG: hypothetical protein NWP79_11770 [Paracoccaceae bacterium]|nr:hypothetical protein [Paracoccaceae bacterium]
MILPTELGAGFDRFYWVVLCLVGVWLVAFICPRLAAIVALLLVTLKLAILQGWLTV